MMDSSPRLTVGLPVYNGENFLAESIEALLGQKYEDFELIISDNASTDSTAEICERYLKEDSRVRYFRQPRNIGCAPNHNFLVEQARGELFKWASSDDLYARDLLERCVAALDDDPGIVLAHSWTAMIDPSSTVTEKVEYGLDTASPSAPQRFRSMLFDDGGDDDGGVMRISMLRKIAPLDSYQHSDRTQVAEISLWGRFYQVPEWLYFRRDHPDRALRANPTVRSWCTNLDPRRADKFRHPLIRLYGEYIWGYISAIQRAPLSPSDRRACYRQLAEWAASRAFTSSSRQPAAKVLPPDEAISVEALVAGADRS
jgi:glycosyltransferase involved in cell wall biosynthesis